MRTDIRVDLNAVETFSESPYGFHMCWTANKRDKIKYFKVWADMNGRHVSDLTPRLISGDGDVVPSG